MDVAHWGDTRGGAELLEDLARHRFSEQRGTEERDLDGPTGFRHDAQVRGDAVRSIRCPLLPCRDHGFGRRRRPDGLEADGQRFLHGGETQRGDHAELAPAGAAECPEELGLAGAVAVDEASVGEHDLSTDEAVARETVRAPQQADPAAEREAGDPDRRSAAGRDGSPVRVQCRVHLRESSAGPHGGESVVGHGDVVHRAQVEHDPVARRSPREAVAAAARRDAQARGSRVTDRPRDVRRRATADDELRMRVPEVGVGGATYLFIPR